MVAAGAVLMRSTTILSAILAAADPHLLLWLTALALEKHGRQLSVRATTLGGLPVGEVAAASGTAHGRGHASTKQETRARLRATSTTVMRATTAPRGSTLAKVLGRRQEESRGRMFLRCIASRELS